MLNVLYVPFLVHDYPFLRGLAPCSFLRRYSVSYFIPFFGVENFVWHVRIDIPFKFFIATVGDYNNVTFLIVRF